MLDYGQNIDGVLRFVKQKRAELERSPSLFFDDYVDEKGNVRKGKLECKGTYVIYESDKPIYVGSAGKGKHTLRYRISDLFSYSPRAKRNPYYHNLTRKLLKEGRFKDRFAVWSFYREFCSFKVIKTENMDEARLLEQVFIILYHHPQYNTP